MKTAGSRLRVARSDKLPYEFAPPVPTKGSDTSQAGSAGIGRPPKRVQIEPAIPSGSLP
jgi:hypothetical protein